MASQDNRQFAPWHYQEPSMLQDEQQQLILPSIEVKEQMHYLPPGYTGATGAPAIARHTMLGNSWHLGVAKFLLWFLLQWTPTTSIPVAPKMSSLQWVLSVSNRSPPTLGPGFWPQEVFEMPPADTMEHHWTLAQQCQHPALSDRALEPGLLQTLHALLTTWSDIPRLRREVVGSFADQTRAWWNELHPHVKHVYDTKRIFSITQVPVFLQLLKWCRYPGLSHLVEDLNLGFDVLGPQHPGVGWLLRLDHTYEHPLDIDTFVRVNKVYIFEKLRTAQVDPHWEVMLQEILVERDRGKLSGPYASPSDWPLPTTTVARLPLLDTPPGLVCPAWSFSVVQADKIRRCEDYRRGFHNSTAQARDSPHHHTIETYAALSRFWLRNGHDSVTWAMDSAYRQIAVRNPCFSYVVLTTPHGHVASQRHEFWRGCLGLGIQLSGRLGDVSGAAVVVEPDPSLCG